MTGREAAFGALLVFLLSGCGRRRDITLPPPSVLLSPADGATVSLDSPQFDWRDEPTAIGYWIQADEGAHFSSPVIDDSALTSSSYAATAPLDDRSYYWRVRAKSETHTWGEWSEVWSFTIDTNPYQIMGVCPTPGYAEDIFVADSFAYVADGQGGLQIIHVSDPRQPWIAGQGDTTSDAQAVNVLDQYAYVAYDGLVGLVIFDVADPANPIIVGHESGWYSASDAFALGVGESTYVHIAAGTWFMITDATDPQFPQFISRFHTPGSARGVWVEGEFTYIADEQMGLQVVDASDPHSPAIVGHCDTPFNARNVRASGSYAYLADGRGGLQIIDITNPADPLIIGSCETPGYANDVFVLGDLAYVADGASGLQVVDVSSPSSPFITGSCQTPYANGAWAIGQTVYVADRDTGLVIVGIAEEE